MKPIFCLLIASILLFACHNGSNSRSTVENGQTKPGVDTVAVITHTNTAKETLRAKSNDQPTTASEEEEGESPDSIYAHYLAEYRTPRIIDTVFTVGVDTLHLYMKHYCLMDSAIRIPGKYTDIYKLDSVVTHNFETTIRLEKNSRTVYQRSISKKDFEKVMHPEEEKYGALFYSGFKLLNDSIEVHYSISIPLTDVGIGVVVRLDRNGRIVYMRS